MAYAEPSPTDLESGLGDSGCENECPADYEALGLKITRMVTW
jgi:hypothetical protein